QSERPARGPAGDLALGDLADQLAVGLHPLAVERWQQRLALAQVLRAVEQQHAAGAEQGLEDRISLARAPDVRVAGEDGLDVVGVADDDPRRAAVDVQRERVAEARALAARVRAGPRDPA